MLIFTTEVLSEICKKKINKELSLDFNCNGNLYFLGEISKKQERDVVKILNIFNDKNIFIVKSRLNDSLQRRQYLLCTLAALLYVVRTQLLYVQGYSDKFIIAAMEFVLISMLAWYQILNTKYLKGMRQDGKV